jgi:hypothetical protein
VAQFRNAISIGNEAGRQNQETNAVAIGSFAGRASQGQFAVSIGSFCGHTAQSQYSVAIGHVAGRLSQGERAVAIGDQTGRTAQASGAVAIGYIAGGADQGLHAISIGHFSGQTSQASGAVAIGSSAGACGQSLNAIAIGQLSGESGQQQYAVSIGSQAGQDAQGTNSIAIGYLAGQTAQHANSIVVNASGSALNTVQADSTYVRPVRDSTTGTRVVLLYEPSTYEITTDIAAAKTFVIPHPEKPETDYLIHACLEGPEAGVYYRGKATTEGYTCVIPLPSYVSKLVKKNSETIQLTSVSGGIRGQVWVDDVKSDYSSFSVVSTVPRCSFYWTFMATRETIRTEVKKSEVNVSGEGPYKYIRTST